MAMILGAAKIGHSSECIIASNDNCTTSGWTGYLCGDVVEMNEQWDTFSELYGCTVQVK